ncbi:hypothetical protein B0H11DRAFT_2239955 [Mycena galericulata]|nr:hypothetical protein B0H11DRAFT_2239955 [Mycena galericulata]
MPSFSAALVAQLSMVSSLPIFPAGCAVETGKNSTLAICCAAVGSTPAEIDGTYGCPYTDAFVPSANQSFSACALERNTTGSC